MWEGHGLKEDVQMSVNIGGSTIQILESQMGSPGIRLRGIQPSRRLGLYDMDPWNGLYPPLKLSAAEVNDVGPIAQRIASWLLDLPLRPSNDRFSFMFSTALTDPWDSPIKVHTVLHHGRALAV